MVPPLMGRIDKIHTCDGGKANSTKGRKSSKMTGRLAVLGETVGRRQQTGSGSREDNRSEPAADKITTALKLSRRVGE